VEPYRVELAAGHEGCQHCGHDQYWTVVSGHGDDAVEIGTSWGDKELAEDVCDLMNMAFSAGQEDPASNKEEEKLVAFFRSPEGNKLGRDGDHDNLTPAETAIRAMRSLP